MSDGVVGLPDEITVGPNHGLRIRDFVFMSGALWRVASVTGDTMRLKRASRSARVWHWLKLRWRELRRSFRRLRR